MSGHALSAAAIAAYSLSVGRPSRPSDGELGMSALRERVLGLLVMVACAPGLAGQDLGDAIYDQDLSAIRALIEAGADVNAVMEGYGVTPLHQAVYQDAGEIVSLLAEAGANIDELGREDRSLLWLAVYNGYGAAARALVRAGADLDRADDDLETPVAVAYRRGEADLFQLLVGEGARLDLPLGSDGSLLHRVVGAGDVEAARLLLEHGAPTDPGDALGSTPLHIAAGKGNVELTSLLLSFGADPEATNAFGMTPRQMAETSGHSGVVQALEQAGASHREIELNDAETTRERVREQLLSMQNALPPDPGDDTPRIHGEGPYPPGFRSGECGLEAHNPPAKAGDSGFVRQVATSFHPGRIDASQLVEEGGLADVATVAMAGSPGALTVAPPDCEPVWLEPGEYTMVTHRARTAWVWEYANGACTPGVYCSIIKVDVPGSFALERTSSYFVVSAGAEEPETTDEPCQAPRIEIVSPAPGENVSFDAAMPKGRLEVAVEAKVYPEECEVEVVWEAQAMAGSDHWFEDGAGNRSASGTSLLLVYEGLPTDNREFGPKTITVTPAGGTAQQVEILTFFDPSATNHPSAHPSKSPLAFDVPDEQVPNWVFYWTQGPVGRLDEFLYRQNVPTEGSHLGWYDYSSGALFIGPDGAGHYGGYGLQLRGSVTYPILSGSTTTSPACSPAETRIRVNGSEGILTTARIVIHELEHQRRHDGDSRRTDPDQDRLVASGLWEDTEFCLAPTDPNTHGLFPVDSTLPWDDQFEQQKSWNRAGDNEITGVAMEREAESLVRASEDWSKCGLQWTAPGC